MTSPPAAIAVLATAAIKPVFPPPYTTPIFRATRILAICRAASTYSSRAPGLDPQNTQMRCVIWNTIAGLARARRVLWGGTTCPAADALVGFLGGSAMPKSRTEGSGADQGIRPTRIL